MKHKAFALAIALFASHPLAKAEGNKSLAFSAGIANSSRLVSPKAMPLSAANTKSAINKSLNGSYPRSHMDRGQYFEQTGQLDWALVEYIKAAQDDPKNLEAYYHQAVIFNQRGFNKLAQASLEQSLAINPQFQKARLLLATISIQHGNIDKAIKEIRKTLGLNPQNTSKQQPPLNLDQIKKEEKTTEPENYPSVIQMPHSYAQVAQPKQIVQEQKAYKTIPVHKAENYGPLLASKSPVRTSNPISNAQPGFIESLLGFGGSQSNSNGLSNEELALNSAGKSMPISVKTAATDQEQSGFHLPSLRIPFISKSKEEKSSSNTVGENRLGKPWFPKLPLLKHGHQAESSKAATEFVQDSLNAANINIDANGNLQNNTQVQKPVVKAGLNSAPRAIVSKPAQSEPDISYVVKAPISGQTEASNSNQNKTTSNTQIHYGSKPANGQMRPVTVQSQQIVKLSNQNQSRTIAPSEYSSEPIDDPKPIETDEWAKKMLHLQKNGTSSLRRGEAFMFSEETGDGVLFLSDGETVRRHIAHPEDPDEILVKRRPDIFKPKDLFVRLSLLGKLLPKQGNGEEVGNMPGQEQSQRTNNFKTPETLGQPDGFWTFVKDVLKM